MNRQIFVTLLAVLIIASVGLAHEESVGEGMDIHMTPAHAFRGDEVAIEAAVEKNGQPVRSLSVTFVVDRHETGLSEKVAAEEREPGRYFIKYAFREPGQHEIHVEFLLDREETRKTFYIDVSGSGAEQYFINAAAAVAALASLYALRTRRIKRAALAAVALLAIIGLSYSVYSLYSTGAAQRGVTVCTGSECYWSAHIHAEVSVEICGKEYRFPVEKGRLDGPHTHEEKNLIHFHERLRIDTATKEILDPQPLTLGAFFDAMEASLSETQVLGKKNGDACTQESSVKMFVNSMPSSSFRDYIWKDGDKIRIVFDESPANAVAKEEQKATAQLTPGLTLPIIVGFALVDSINPCVIGVLLLLITVLLKSRKKRSILSKGAAYSAGVYITYLIGGITLLSVFNAIREVQAISQLFYIIAGMIVLFAAFLEVKDYFWYGRGISLAIPKRFIATVEGGAHSAHTSIVSAMIFGAAITLIELPCTGAPYLAIITLMSQSGMQFYSALLLLLLYNLIFILPLIVIIVLAYKGVGYKKMESWRRKHKGRMRLAVGLMLLGISVWIITTVLDWALPYLLAASALAVVIMFALKRIEENKPYRR